MPLVLFRSQASAFCGKTVIVFLHGSSYYPGSIPGFHIRPENIYKGAEKHLLYDFSNTGLIFFHLSLVSTTGLLYYMYEVKDYEYVNIKC